MARLRARLENGKKYAIDGEQLYEIESKALFSWNWAGYKYAKSPEEAMERFKAEQAQKKIDREWSYNG